MLTKVLVANRGEIAIRVMRACRESGINTVAVFSDADRDSIFVNYADQAFYIGANPARDSYLNINKIVEVALFCGAQAIHPGYGFLAENAEFARACEDKDIIFIGPGSNVLELVGNKVSARNIATQAGIRVIPVSTTGTVWPTCRIKLKRWATLLSSNLPMAVAESV
jgi:pyruvate carboxylase subunit A